MAQKYQSYRKKKGFKPIQVSDAGVQKIIQQGNQKINALREDLNWEKGQRDRVLTAMKENARAEGKRRDLNFNRETDNRELIQRRVQENFQRERENVENRAKAQSELYKQLGGLSLTANKELRRLEQEKFDRDYQDEYAKILVSGPDYFKMADYENLEDQLKITSAENDVGADALAATGASRLQVERVRSNSKGRQYARDQAAAIFALESFTPWAVSQLQTDNQTEVLVNGRVITPTQASTVEEKAAVMYSLLTPYLKEKGLFGLKPEFLTKPLLKARQGINTYLTGEANIEAQKLATQRVEEARSTFFSNPDSYNSTMYLENLTSYFNGDRVRALDYLWNQAIDLSDDELNVFLNATFAGRPRPIGEDSKKNRVPKLMEARAQKAREGYRAENETRSLQAKAFERKAIDGLVQMRKNEKAITEKDLDLLQEEYMKYSTSPSDAIESWKDETVTAKENAKLIEQAYTAANAGRLSQKTLNLFPITIRNDSNLKAAAKQYEDLYSATPYKSSLQTLKGLLSDQGKQVGEQFILNPGAIIVYEDMKAEYDRIYRSLVLGDKPMSPINANEAALAQVVEKYRQAQKPGNEDHRWHNNITINGDQGYSNVLQLDSEVASEARQLEREKETRDIRINQALILNPNVIDAIVNTKPGLLFTQESAKQLYDNYYKPGFVVPLVVKELASRTNVNVTDLINAQFKTYGMPEIPPPPSMQLTDSVPAEIRSILLNAQSAANSIRGLSVTGSFNQAAIPKGLGSIIREAGETYNIDPAIIAGVIETESSWQMYATSKRGAQGLAQFMPGTAAEMGVDVNDPKSSIMGAAKYLRHIMDNWGYDIKRALYAYNAGPNGGVGLTPENKNYLPKVMAAAAKYGYGKQSFVEPSLLRPSMVSEVAYITGNIGGGPYYTGEHLDVKQTNGGYFDHNELDDYVEVEDPKYGVVPLSKVGVTGDWGSHTRRNSHGIDFGTADGSRIRLKNGATVVMRGDSGDGNGDVLVFTIPDGREFQFLHGTLPE